MATALTTVPRRAVCSRPVDVLDANELKSLCSRKLQQNKKDAALMRLEERGVKQAEFWADLLSSAASAFVREMACCTDAWLTRRCQRETRRSQQTAAAELRGPQTGGSRRYSCLAQWRPSPPHLGPLGPITATSKLNKPFQKDSIGNIAHDQVDVMTCIRKNSDGRSRCKQREPLAPIFRRLKSVHNDVQARTCPFLRQPRPQR